MPRWPVSVIRRVRYRTTESNVPSTSPLAAGIPNSCSISLSRVPSCSASCGGQSWGLVWRAARRENRCTSARAGARLARAHPSLGSTVDRTHRGEYPSRDAPRERTASRIGRGAGSKRVALAKARECCPSMPTAPRSEAPRRASQKRGTPRNDCDHLIRSGDRPKGQRRDRPRPRQRRQVPSRTRRVSESRYSPQPPDCQQASGQGVERRNQRHVMDDSVGDCCGGGK